MFDRVIAKQCAIKLIIKFSLIISINLNWVKIVKKKKYIFSASQKRSSLHLAFKNFYRIQNASKTKEWAWLRYVCSHPENRSLKTF